jgi:hypothetical protein
LSSRPASPPAHPSVPAGEWSPKLHAVLTRGPSSQCVRNNAGVSGSRRTAMVSRSRGAGFPLPPGYRTVVLDLPLMVQRVWTARIFSVFRRSTSRLSNISLIRTNTNPTIPIYRLSTTLCKSVLGGLRNRPKLQNCITLCTAPRDRLQVWKTSRSHGVRSCDAGQCTLFCSCQFHHGVKYDKCFIHRCGQPNLYGRRD